MRSILGIIIFFGLFFLVHLYLYKTFKLHFNSKIFRFGWWVLFGLLIIGMISFSSLPRIFSLLVLNIVGILFLSELFTVIIVGFSDIFRLLFGVVKPAIDEPTNLGRRKFISTIGLVSLTLPLGTFLYGMFKTAYDFNLIKLSLNFKNLPRKFAGFKIVQISDIHTGSFLKKDELENAVNLILEQKPDVIFFTGDLVNNRTDEAYPFIETLSKLKAPFGVYSSLGNHDYGDYEPWPSKEAKEKNFADMIQLHKDLGWKLLNNEHVILDREEEKIAIIGVENWGAALRFPRKGDIIKAKLGTEDVPFKVLLSHDPSHWEAQILPDHQDIDLMLSGHTHGFQFGIEIPGFKWSPSQWVYKQWAGIYEKNGQYINVNRGLGCLGYSGRVGIKPEITVITLTT